MASYQQDPTALAQRPSSFIAPSLPPEESAARPIAFSTQFENPSVVECAGAAELLDSPERSATETAPLSDTQSATPLKDDFAHSPSQRPCSETPHQTSSLPTLQERRVARPSGSPRCTRAREREERFIRAVIATYGVYRRSESDPKTRFETRIHPIS